MGEDAPPRKAGRPRSPLASEAASLRASGLSDAAIAGRLGVARTTVTRWLGPARAQGRPGAAIDAQAVAAARADGASWREVERRTGAKRSTAHRRAAETS